MKARKAACGYCGTLRAVRLDGRFWEHLGAAGWRCAGGGRVVVITAGEAEPGDVVEFPGGRRAPVAAVHPSRSADDSPACYVTILHAPAGVPALTVCFADTRVRLAGTVSRPVNTCGPSGRTPGPRSDSRPHLSQQGSEEPMTITMPDRAVRRG